MKALGFGEFLTVTPIPRYIGKHSRLAKGDATKATVALISYLAEAVKVIGKGCRNQRDYFRLSSCYSRYFSVARIRA
jgi:hypothetical protein